MATTRSTGSRQRLANLMWRSLQETDSVPRTLLDEAQRQKDEAERTLAERSVEARTELARVHTGLQDIRQALPAGTAGLGCKLVS